LRIDPDAVLPATIADELFQPVPGWDPKILNVLRCVDQL